MASQPSIVECDTLIFARNKKKITMNDTPREDRKYKAKENYTTSLKAVLKELGLLTCYENWHNMILVLIGLIMLLG
jgi:hypothetical protein